METKPEEQTAEIQKVEPQQIQRVVIPDDAPLMTRMAMMMENGITIDADQMAKMQEIAERFEANEARKAFHVAMAEFKKDPPQIFKNKTVTYGEGDKTTSYMHVTLASLASILDEHFAKCDLSFTWKTEDLDKGLVKVTCILTHKLGHSESSSMTSLPDGSGKKNPIQAKGSAITYLQRYTLKSVAGVAEVGQDDDGAAAGNGETKKAPAFKPITADEFQVLDAICEKIKPAAPGFVINKKRIGSLLLERNRAGLVMSNVDKAAAWVMKFGDYDLYEISNSAEPEIPAEFEEEYPPGHFGEDV